MNHRNEPASDFKPPVSMADLARALGVSMTTVSRALSNHPSIGAATKQRVLKMARQHNYAPNHLATALRKGKSQLLGVVVPYLEGHFFPLVVQGIEAAARQAGYSVIIAQSNEDVGEERRLLELLRQAQVAGVLVSVSRSTRDVQHFQQLPRQGVPVVFFDRVPGPEPVHAVVLDDHRAGYLSTQHLLAQGCRRVAHLSGPEHLSIYHNRCAGYQQALREAGLPADEQLLVVTDMSQDAGAAALRQLLTLPDPPDAVFAAGDYCALGVLEEARRQGLRVPEDLAVTGFSNERFTLVTEPALTTVDQCCGEMGRAALRLLLDLVHTQDGPGLSPRQVVLTPSLLVRGSSLRAALTGGRAADQPATGEAQGFGRPSASLVVQQPFLPV